ncbi:MAG TPA: tetratricopeptide repeat protein [Candidatus Saccharimonadales bacterium]|nr:tetratricopeptide repeat protein [Candidatus Saccharimonadales bacterium]
MVTIKNRFPASLNLFILSALVFLSGCTPPGPRALLKGEKLIQEGKWEEAVLRLQEATQLLPNNAQAWNHLGIAYHGNHQTELALKCYRTALSLDRNLAATRYNLGCLLLEQNDFTGASEQLTSFTFLQPASLAGWLKLGTAQLRNKKNDLAEKSFKTALEIHPNDPEALNDLGLIHLQRRRPQEAIAYFNLALAQNTNYAPAILNLAILIQQNQNTRAQALQHYKRYLAIQPKPAEYEKVQALAGQLEADLNPPPLQLNPITHAAAPLKTNPPAVSSNAVASTVRAVPPPTNPVVATVRTNSPAVIASNPPRSTAVAAVTPPAPAPEVTNKPPPAEVPRPPLPKPAPLEVAEVQNDFLVKPPQEVVTSRASDNPPLPRVGATERSVTTAADSNTSKPDKRNLFTKLNPFATKPKTQETTPAPAYPASVSSQGKIIIVNPDTNATGALERVPVARYQYTSPLKPVAGNHKEAEKYFNEGIRLHKAGQLTPAIANYQKATQVDPGYFEAYYNQGLAAYDLGRFKHSLLVYEYALALKPDSADARYNFALAMKQAGYPLDAATELERILNAHPNEIRSHYSLANIYAHQLKQPREAREHYQKVLELQPNHPRASEIRFWMGANP